MPSLFSGYRTVVPQHVPPRIYRRVPFETAVRLKFDRFHGFVEQYCGNLSLGGMFINSDEPPPLGTEVTVEFELEDGFELIRGRGRVAWVREPGDESPGYGLRFLELTPGSRELIFRLVERRVREGDRVFDLEDQAPAAAALLVHDEGHARLVDDEDRVAAPPWDRPAPRPGEAGAGGTAAAAAGGEVVRYGRAAREAAEAELSDAELSEAEVGEAEPGDAARGQVGALRVGDEQVGAARPDPPAVEPAPDEAAPADAGRAEAAAPAVGGDAAVATTAGVEDPEASFAGLVDDEDAADGAAAASADETAAGAERGDDRWIASAAAVEGARWPWLEAEAAAAAEAAPPAPGEEPAMAEGSEEAAAGESAARVSDAAGAANAESGAGPVRPRRGLRLAVATAAGIAVLALVAFLLLRTSDAGAPAGRTAGEPPANPAATAAGEGAAGPDGADGALPADGTEGARPEDGTSRAAAAAPASGPGTAATAADPAGAASAAGPGTIERIAWQRRDGGVDFEIAGGGPIAPALVDHFTVGGERPRLVVRIAGVERPYSRGDLAVGGPPVERVRTGFHPAAAGAAGSLHVVFDLTAPAAAAAVDTAGGRVRVRFEGR